MKRDGEWTKLDVSELVVGDVIQLAAGERVPADIRLTRVRDCFLSESAVTGESELQGKNSRAHFRSGYANPGLPEHRLLRDGRGQRLL